MAEFLWVCGFGGYGTKIVVIYQHGKKLCASPFGYEDDLLYLFMQFIKKSRSAHRFIL